MTTTQEALRKALEQLELCRSHPHVNGSLADLNDAINAIAALPQQEPQPVAWCVANPNGDNPPVLIYGNGAALKPGDMLYAAAPAPTLPHPDDLAWFIRTVDSDNNIGAGMLAERICDWLSAAPNTDQKEPK